MEEVTAESNSQFIAFRRLLYSLSKQLSKDEAQEVVFIYFFEKKESFSAATPLDVLCKLESGGIATSSNPEKLLELMKDLKRQDLANEVKDFLKKRKKSSSLNRKQQKRENNTPETENEDDLILRSTLEAAVVQATVLIQHMEVIQGAIAGNKIHKTKIKEIVTEAAQTSEALAERLRRAEVKVNLDQNHRRQSSGSRSGSGSGSEFLSSSREKTGLGYINAQKIADRYGELMASSVPNLAQCYNTKSPMAQASQDDESNKKQSQNSDDDEDEDDYEHMNPGVIVEAEMAGLMLSRYKHPLSTKPGSSQSVSPNQFRLPSRPAQGQVRSSVQYSSVVIPKDSNARPTIAEKPRKSPVARQRKSTPIDYTQVTEFKRKPAEGDSVPNALTSIPERYSPQHRAGRLTQSVCVDSSPSISRYVGSPPTTSRRTSSSSSLDSSSTSRYYVDTSPSHRYVDSSLSSSPYVDSRKPDISDDNYTTLHLAPRRGEGSSNDPHYYQPLNVDQILPQDGYTRVRHTDS